MTTEIMKNKPNLYGHDESCPKSVPCPNRRSKAQKGLDPKTFFEKTNPILIFENSHKPL